MRSVAINANWTCWNAGKGKIQITKQVRAENGALQAGDGENTFEPSSEASAASAFDAAV